jgi:O-antigen/teichoic acid export membrane protein
MMKRLIQGGLLQNLNIIILAAIALFSMPIMIHNLGDRNYSLFTLVGSIIGLVSLIDLGFNRGFSQSLSTAYGKDDTKTLNEVISSGVVINCVISGLLLLILGGIALTGSWWVTNLNDKSLFVTVLMIMGVTAAIRIPTRMAGEVLRNVIRYELITMGTLTEAIIRVGASVWAVTNGYGLVTVASIMLVTSTLESLWEFRCAKKVLPNLTFTPKHFSWTTTLNLFKYSSATFISDTADKTKNQIIPVLVTSLVSLEAVVFLVVAQRLIDYSVLLISSWSNMLTVIFGQLHGNKNQKKLEQVLSKGTAVIVIMVSYITLCLILYSQPFITVWLGEKYVTSANLIHILIVPTAIGCIMSLSKEYLFGIGKIHKLIWLHLTELVLFALVSVPLGLRYGLEGIAWSLLLVITPLELIGVSLIIQKTVTRSWWSLYKEPLKILVQFAVVAIPVAWFVGPMIQNSFLSIIVFNVVQLLVFAPLIWFLLPDYFQQKFKLKILAYK